MNSFEELADSIPDQAPPVCNNSGDSFSGDWGFSQAVELVREVISVGGISVMRETQKGSDLYFNLRSCVFDETHTNNDAAIIIMQNGKICYHCFHASCGDKVWSDVRALIAPKKPQYKKQKSAIPTRKETAAKTSIVEELKYFYDNGLPTGNLTGWAELDNYYTIMLGLWTLVTGIPSHGKSSWLDALLVNLAHQYGWKFGVFSPENQPTYLHASKLTEIFAGQSFFGSHRWEKMGRDDMLVAAQKVNATFKFIKHGDDILTLDGILIKAQALVDEYGIKGLVIDPWNEIDHQIGTDTETIYISKALTRVRMFARKNNIHVWIVAHPTKLRRNDSGGYDPPTPYDVAGGAHWRNKADCAITIHRPTFKPGDSRVDVLVQKIRFKHVGKPGKITLEYKLNCGQYKDTF